MEEVKQLDKERYHRWENRKGELVCLGCGTKGNGVAGIDQNCSGPIMANLFETIIDEAELQQTDELRLVIQEV